MKTLLISILTLLLFSCSSPDNTGQIESLKVLQSCTLDQLCKADEKLGGMKDIVADITQPEGFLNKTRALLALVERTDSLSYPLISQLNSIRSTIVGTITSKSKQPNKPVIIEYTSNFKLNKSALPDDDQIKEMIMEIETYRNDVCRFIVESYPPQINGKVPKFRIPKSTFLKNNKQITNYIDATIENSLIFEEDINAVHQIMQLLTKKHDTWRAMLSEDESWINLSMNLLSIQNLLLESRTIAFAVVHYRTGCCESFNFSHISPIIVGSSNALPNDTIQFQVYLAAYNEYLEPEFTVSNGGRLVKIENGKGTIEAVVPASGEIEIKGEIQNVRKSGKYSKREWSHKINVIKPNQP